MRDCKQEVVCKPGAVHKQGAVYKPVKKSCSVCFVNRIFFCTSIIFDLFCGEGEERREEDGGKGRGEGGGGGRRGVGGKGNGARGEGGRGVVFQHPQVPLSPPSAPGTHRSVSTTDRRASSSYPALPKLPKQS